MGTEVATDEYLENSYRDQEWNCGMWYPIILEKPETIQEYYKTTATYNHNGRQDYCQANLDLLCLSNLVQSIYTSKADN